MTTNHKKDIIKIKKNMQRIKISSKKIFIIISVFILVTDSLFVAINYKSSQEELKKELLRQKSEYTSSFDQYIENAYLSMQKLSNYIANDKTVIRLFETGRTAFINNDNETATKYRNNLYNYLKSSWQALQGKYFVRQLHFHIGPGDTSFLRVHKPEKYGDDLSSIRHTIVDSIKFNKEVTGFESGRVYSGLRGVTPILDQDKKVIGALEAGTSFKEIINNLSSSIHTEFAILLDVNYMKETMWAERLQPFFDKEPPIKNAFIEATSSPFIKDILTKSNVDLKIKEPQVLELNGKYYSLFLEDLHSYETLRDHKKKGVGQVVMWRNITPLIKAHKEQFIINLLYALLAFIFIELAFYKGLKLVTRKLENIVAQQKSELIIKNQRLEKFNHMISHDLKNSLNSIIGMSDISLHSISELEDKKTKEHLAESLGFILYAGKHMDKLITNMLVYSEDGVKDKNLYDLKSLINEVRSILKDEIEKSQAQIIFPQEDAFVYVNKILFIQVLFNLINNSIKYKDANRKPEIYIAFEHTEKETKFTLKDNGIGIEEENLSKVFNLSFREEKANQKTEGHGIGLHTVHDIIKAHKGEIKALPCNNGAAFVITLPNQQKD